MQVLLAGVARILNSEVALYQQPGGKGQPRRTIAPCGLGRLHEQIARSHEGGLVGHALGARRVALGPLSRGRYGFGRGAPRKRPQRLRATYNRKHGIRYIFGAFDVHRDRLYARMRPRRAGSDALGFIRAIRLCSRARQKIYWIQDNLSANWTADIPRSPTPTGSSSSRPRPAPATRSDREPLPTDPGIGLNNTDYRDWNTAQRAVADYTTHRNWADRDRRVAALERKHHVAL